MNDSQESSNIPKYFLPPKKTNKKTLVLDLDETLVHSQFFEFSIPSDITIKIEIEKEIYDIHVLVRPGVEKFIKTMKDYYEIIIFTASISKYADILMNIIDPNNYCPYRLFREHCSFINNNYVKDLKRLGRNLKDTIIVDNSPLSYSFHPNNGLPILSWFDDYRDNELENITPILIFLSGVDDVREYIPKIVKNNCISYIDAENLMKMHGFIFEDTSSIDKNIKIIDSEQKEKSTKTSINKDKKNENVNKKKTKKFNINIQIVQNNINNINNIIDEKQNKDIKNKIIKYFGIINNTEQKNNPKQNPGGENIIQIKQKNIITNKVNPNKIVNTVSNKLDLNKKGHKRQNTFNFNLNNSKLIEKYKEAQFIKINNLNKKNVVKKSIKEGKNNLNNSKAYFQHIKNILNKNRKRIRTPTTINTIGFISNSNKYNFLKIKHQKNSGSKSQKRNKSNTKERTKLKLPLESSELILSKQICNLSNISTKGNITNNKQRNKNKVNKIKIVPKYNSISNRKTPYNNYDFLNISLNANNFLYKNRLNRIIKDSKQFVEAHHKKQKSLNEINFMSKLKNNLIKKGELKSLRPINKNDFMKNEKQKNIKSNHIRLNTNINGFKNRLIKRTYGNFKKINLKNINFITKKDQKKIQINFNYKNTENISNVNYKNYYNFYRTIDKSEPKREKDKTVLSNMTENLINKSYRKISHQKTISYNINSSLNISNILNPKTKYKTKFNKNSTSKNNAKDKKKESLCINKNNNNKTLYSSKIKKVVNKKI